MSRLAKTIVLCLSLAVFASLVLGYALGKTAGNDERSYRSLTVYGEVLQRIEQDYVDEPNMAQVTAGALHGLLESLDPLSSYMSAREYAEYKQKAASGAKGETGVALSKRFGYIIVVSILPDSPAQKAGLHDGDWLESIGGFATREMSVGQAMQILAGAPGSSVKVAVIRRTTGSTPQDVEVQRAQLAPAHVTVDKVDPDIAYLRVPSLDAGKADEIREKLQQLDKQGVRKLVVDLRDCARGDISEGVAVARLFVSSGTVAVLKGQTLDRKEFPADPSKVVWKYPVDVLIWPTTSGAAEIVAGAIGGNKRGDLIGERTFGTASEQKLIPLEDGAAIVLTVGYYYTPAGKSIPEEGVTPTVEVRASPDDESSDGIPAKQPSLDDPVLRKAVELLKGETQHKVSLRIPTSLFSAIAHSLPA